MRTIKTKLMVVAMTVLVASVALAGTPPDQQRTMDKVRRELVTLPYYGVFDNLEYKLEGGSLTLYGQVVRPSTREDAARRVARIESVDRAVNNIDMRPLSGFDDSIRAP